MKSIVVVVVVAAFSVGCQNAEPKKTGQQQSGSAKAEVASTDIDVKTIKCAQCVTTITNALNEIDGVKNVSVDLEKKKTHVEYVSSMLTLSALETAIAKAGYDANNVKREEAAYLHLDKCCQ